MCSEGTGFEMLVEGIRYRDVLGGLSGRVLGYVEIWGWFYSGRVECEGFGMSGNECWVGQEGVG